MKLEIRKIKNSNKGITIVALIVTVIVLIILATISIGAITGDEGIINNAKYSAFASKIRQYEEKAYIYIR